MDANEFDSTPFEPPNRAELREALDQVGESVQKLLDISGLTEDELIAAVVPTDQHYNALITDDPSG